MKRIINDFFTEEERQLYYNNSQPKNLSMENKQTEKCNSDCDGNCALHCVLANLSFLSKYMSFARFPQEFENLDELTNESYFH
jgi:hypothetical protein